MPTGCPGRAAPDKAAPPHYPGSRREIITNTNTTTTSKGAFHMTNDEIIYNEVNAKYHTPEQRRAILALAYTPEQIAAKGKEIHFKDVPEERQGEELEKLLLAGLFHTFQEWKKDGKSVKTGEKATICTKLWKFDDRPRKTSASMEPDALTAAANDQRPDGNYYKAPAHLFHIGQVEASRPAPAGRFKSLDEIKAYNRMLADQRKAAKAAAEQPASAPAEIPAKAEAPAKPTTKPAKKAATKPAAKPSAPQKAAQPAPDALHKAERKACAAFLAVPETDRKGQAAALDTWRKTRKAVEDAKQTPAAVAVLDEAPVKQLDFESIAAGLLA
nr:MAG: protein of unknown function DUF1738 [Bacteriophage sp.]